MLAGQGLAGLVIDKEVIAQMAHMAQALDIQVGQGDEQAKLGHRGDHALELVADVLLHVVAFQPAHHLP